MDNIINDKQKFYKWIIDALKPDKSLSAYQVALILKKKKLIPLATMYTRKNLENTNY